MARDKSKHKGKPRHGKSSYNEDSKGGSKKGECTNLTCLANASDFVSALSGGSFSVQSLYTLNSCGLCVDHALKKTMERSVVSLTRTPSCGSLRAHGPSA